MPPRASVAAIPGPIVPRPITAAFVILSPATAFDSIPGDCSADGLLERWSRRHLAAPRLQPIELRQLDREVQTTMDDRTQADVRQGDGAARNPGTGFQGAVQGTQLLAELLGVL